MIHRSTNDVSIQTTHDGEVPTRAPRRQPCDHLWWAAAWFFPVVVLYYGFKFYGLHFIRVMVGF